MRVTVT